MDPATHLAAVGVRSPYGLALVDTRTGRRVRTVPLPGHVRHLAVRGSQVLVPVEDAGRLLVVDLPSGRISQDVATAGYPHGVSAVGPDAALVGNERGARVSLIRDGVVVATASGFPQPGGSAATSTGLYIVDVSSWRLTRLDLALRAGPSVAAGQGPTHAVADSRGDVLVADTRGDAVLVFSPDLQQRRRIPLPGKPYGLAYDARRDTVYVTLTATNELVALSGPDRTESQRWPTVRQPNTVGVDTSTGTIVVASRTDGTVELIDP